HLFQFGQITRKKKKGKKSGRQRSSGTCPDVFLFRCEGSHCFSTLDDSITIDTNRRSSTGIQHDEYLTWMFPGPRFQTGPT
uniref:Uncharacterized protein n=1 Tax=Stegastes partitus TaxID=144197 RepID=A0A3B4YY17_9TELE